MSRCRHVAARYRSTMLPKNPTKTSWSRRGEESSLPVLARLPDTADLPAGKPRSDRAAAAGFVDYRFDIPAGADLESQPRHATSRPITATPHMFQQRPRSEFRRKSFAASRVLPDSDPFALPTTSLTDRLVPVAQFLTLFLLFTAVGTFLLSNQRDTSRDNTQQMQAPELHAPVTKSPSLEPAPKAAYPAVPAPTAFGPLGSRPDSADTDASPFEDLNALPKLMPPMLARDDGSSLPQVQTAEPVYELETASAATTAAVDTAINASGPATSKPPAVARLPEIFPPPRQAYHDNHQPGLH